MFSSFQLCYHLQDRTEVQHSSSAAAAAAAAARHKPPQSIAAAAMASYQVEGNVIRHDSGRKVWWACDKHTDGHPHAWAAQVNSRCLGNRCPCCTKQLQSCQSAQLSGYQGS